MTHEGRSAETLEFRFSQIFLNQSDIQIARAPGRVNLIGGHTDYNEGWTLPMAIDRYVTVGFRVRNDHRIRAHASLFDETEEADIDSLESAGRVGWFSYVAGMAWAMAREGLGVRGVDLLIDGDLPLGAGLSSSAALEMAVARALCEVSEIDWNAKEMARLGQLAENRYVGVRSGRMDQIACAASERGCALLLDCRSFDTEAVPLSNEVEVVVMSTGKQRSLADSAYNERRSSCELAVEVLRRIDPRVRALRDVDPTLLEAAQGQMSEITFRRAKHVVEEDSRPVAMAAALRSGDFAETGRLLNSSHQSLRDLYEVSCPELDEMVGLAQNHDACFGARLTGAGFGGCAIALVEAAAAGEFIDEVYQGYRSKFDHKSELFVCKPVSGAGLIDPTSASSEPSEASRSRAG